MNTVDKADATEPGGVDERSKKALLSYAGQELLPVLKLDGVDAGAVSKLLKMYADEMSVSPGSSHNHQAWLGGYVDHIRDVLLTASALYPAAEQVHPLPFRLADVHKVLLLHDAEKPILYARGGKDKVSHEDRLKIAMDVAIEAGFDMTVAHGNAMRYVHGEGSDYSGSRRVMGELAAFCHVCDVMSARVWHSVGKGSRPPVPDGDNGDVDTVQPKGNMDIYAEKGHLVVPVNEFVAKIIGHRVLTVDHTVPSRKRTSVYLKEIPGAGFDSRLFNDK